MGTDRKHRKCDICFKRTDDHRVLLEETGDIEKLEQASGDNRMVLLSVSFNLADWLAEKSNSGIFCHTANKANKLKEQKTVEHQRFNSFGRFRRIWRSTEIFLNELCGQIQEISGPGDEDRFLMRTILLAPQDLQIILPAAKARQALDAVYEKFSTEFGRVSDRMPFHVSLCIFPFRVPIYLVLEAARRLRQSCLKIKPKQVWLHRADPEDEHSNLLRTDSRADCDDRERSFTYCLPMIWTQNYQPPNMLNGKDQFHANIQVKQEEDGNTSWQWKFVGEIGQGEKKGAKETVLMTDNRLAIVEISSGFSLDELARPSEELEPSRCHDIPLGYWPCIKELIKLESRLSEKQQRGLRSVLAMREKLWQESDLPGATAEEKQNFLRQSIRLLWQEPSRFGPTKWGNLHDHQRNLLEESCLNGAVFLASAVKKHLQHNDDKEQDHG